DRSRMCGRMWLCLASMRSLSAADCQDRKLQAINNANLAENGRQVILYRTLGDRQVAGDVLVALAPRDQTCDFDLARRQNREASGHARGGLSGLQGKAG